MNNLQRLTLWVSILASFVAFLDGSVVNVALPSIANEFGANLTVQQWVVDAYAITLGALMLIAGSLSDLYGRRKIMMLGLVGFGVTSLLCAVAPSSQFLIISRGLQGIAGALLVPSSLAFIISAFKGAAQAKAIGTWVAWTGIAFVIGPLVGGSLVDALSWRLIFLINVLPIAVTIWLLSRLSVPHQQASKAKADYPGAILCALGLAGTAFALIEQPHYGWSSPAIYLPLALGIASLIVFWGYERRAAQAMLPLELFKIRNFSFGNLATVAIYAAITLNTFIIAIFVQEVGGYSALQAGLALTPITVIMFFLSSRFGGLAGRFGPRWFMTIGPLIMAVGLLSMTAVNKSVSYWSLLPGIVLIGLGMSVTVSPLTSAVLGSINEAKAGIASAVNNAVSRIAGLVAVAAISTVIGSQMDLSGFHTALIITAGLLVAGGLISLAGIQNHKASPETSK